MSGGIKRQRSAGRKMTSRTQKSVKRQTAVAASPRRVEKRKQVIDVAMRHFAERGYDGTRIEDIAKELGFAKGLIFQYFGSKGGLFLESYKVAVCSLPSYLQAPAEIQKLGFFETLRYW